MSDIKHNKFKTTLAREIWICNDRGGYFCKKPSLKEAVEWCGQKYVSNSGYRVVDVYVARTGCCGEPVEFSDPKILWTKPEIHVEYNLEENL